MWERVTELSEGDYSIFSISADKLPEIALEAVVVFSGSLLVHVFKMSLALLKESGVGCGEVWYRPKHCNCKEGRSF